MIVIVIVIVIVVVVVVVGGLKEDGSLTGSNFDCCGLGGLSIGKGLVLGYSEGRGYMRIVN